MIDGMGIEGLGLVAKTRPRARVDNGRFAIPDRTGNAPRAGVSAPVAGLSMDGLLALQAGVDAEERNRKAHLRGQELLDAMATLQRMLLAGGDLTQDLRRLVTLTQDMPAAVDPALAILLRSILLRARVELARQVA